MKTVTFGINGMHCSGFARLIQSFMERREGVQASLVSFEERTARALFDPARINVDQLRLAMEKAGYQIEPPRDVPDTTA